MIPMRPVPRGTDARFGDPHPGRVLDGRYLLGERIARGGMASVYTATDLRLDRTVAVKIMHPGLGDDDAFAARFVGEARAAARLSHPNVVAVFDQGEDDGTVFLAMELVRGHTLRDAIAQRAPISPLHALALLAPVVDALASAHRAGLIHRDVKPENVLIAEDGRVKVADFGLAKAMSSVTQHTATGMLIGTVSYVAPEIVTEGRSDARGDVYAVGVILYELLTGHKPHAGETPIQVAYQHVHLDVPAPSRAAAGIPPYVDALVARATARDPGLRPADARVLKHHLDRVRTALAAGLADDEELTADLEPRSRAVREDTAPLPHEGSRRARDDDAWEHSALALDAGPPETPTLARTAVRPTVGAATRPPQPRARPTGPPPARPRRSRRGPVLLVLALLLAAAIGVGAWWLGYARYTVTPAVLGLEQSAADRRLDALGLDAAVADQVYSDTVPAGRIVASDPSPGQRILDGGTVATTVSLGVEVYDVPTLRGLDEDAAQDALAGANLAFGSSEERFSENVAAGVVLSSDPPAGLRVRPGTAVDLVLSRGRQPVRVGRWEGREAATAVERINRRGLEADTTAAEYSETVPEGEVIRQSPTGAETLFLGDTVTLVVSLGPELVTVPDGLVAAGVDAATDTLEAAGFTVAVRNAAEYLGLGYVLRTSVGSGERVPRGSVVVLFLI